MSNRNSWINDLFVGMAFIGGAWLAYDIIKKSSRKKIMYHCPECDSLIDDNIKECPHCEMELIWE